MFSIIILNYLIAFHIFCKKGTKTLTHISVLVRQFLISTLNLSMKQWTLFKLLSTLTAADKLSNFILQTIWSHKRLPR